MPKITPLVVLLAALPNYASALGLGDISLQSRLGQAFLAEIPLIGAAGSPPESRCFSIAANPSGDLPNIPSGQVRVIRKGGQYYLRLSSHRSITDPLLQLTVSASCGYDIDRSYLLMPDPPMSMADAPSISAPRTEERGQTTGNPHVTGEGDTLSQILDSQDIGNASERRRLGRAIKRANPHLNFNAALPAGTLVRIPDLPPQAEPPSTAPAAPARRSEPGIRATASARTPSRPTAAQNSGPDRLMLGAPLAPTAERAELPPPPLAVQAPPGSMAETQQRLVQLESTMRVLTQEIEKLDSAIDLVTKAVEAQNKLQALSSAEQRPQITSRAGAPTQDSKWIDIVIGTVAGAASAIGLMAFFGRRRRYPGDAELPLAFASAKPHKDKAPPAEVPPKVEIPQESAAEPAAIVVDAGAPLQSDTLVSEIPPDDEHSVLALAEIMIAFGREQGAAETLAELIEHPSQSSILPWSKLLDLYRRTGKQSEFEALAARMQKRFNMAAPQFEDGTPRTGLLSLEAYQHAIEEIRASWGSQRCLDYLYKLSHDNRAGKRTGFPLEVIEDIAVLIQVLEEGYGLKRQS